MASLILCRITDQCLTGNDGSRCCNNDTGKDKPRRHGGIKRIHRGCENICVIQYPGSLTQVIENQACFNENPGNSDVFQSTVRMEFCKKNSSELAGIS